MIASAACLAAGNSMVRVVAVELHPFQIGFLTNLVVLTVVWPALLQRPSPIHRTRRRRLYTLTALFGGVSNLTWFYALANVPLAEATAITFAAPILVTAAAGLIFGEVVSGARWMAVLGGFLGVLLIVRPGFAVVDLGLAAVLVSTVGMAGMYLFSKQLARVDSTRRTAAMMTVIPVAVGFVPAWWVWQWPGWYTVGGVLVMSAAMFGGRVALLLALRNAPASTVMPFDFARLPFIAAIAFLAFGEIPDAAAVIGSSMIVAASLLVVHEERAGRRRTPA
jgi:drug/metabolite transporter (DMT)-like permease